MRTLATVALGLLLSVGMITPAAADPGVPQVPNGSRAGVTPTSKCVTKSEFYSLEQRKTTRAQAEVILDWEGSTISRRAGVETWRQRRYRGCNGAWGESAIWVYYGKYGRVADAIWLMMD